MRGDKPDLRRNHRLRSAVDEVRLSASVGPDAVEEIVGAVRRTSATGDPAALESLPDYAGAGGAMTVDQAVVDALAHYVYMGTIRDNESMTMDRARERVRGILGADYAGAPADVREACP